jgi:alanine racemase
MVQLSEMEEMNIEVGEEVVLVGSQGEETITVEELATHTGTINYEFVCMLASRVARVYTRDGQPMDIDNRLL